ncbi:MAG: hypothetical protein GY856_27865, partial [bacterium]|nr:hypothetical protein [bacterium]
ERDGQGVDRVDARLRELLEPHPLTVERVVRGALRGADAKAQRRSWPRLAVASAVALLAVCPIPAVHVLPPRSDDPEPPAPAEPVRLSITNESGPVTITNSAGAKMIIFPGEPS